MSEHHDAVPEFSDDEITEQKAVRLAKRERLNAASATPGGGAYPVSVPVTDTIPAVRARFGELEADGTTGVTVGLAGRVVHLRNTCLLYTSPSPRDGLLSRMPSSA